LGIKKSMWPVKIQWWGVGVVDCLEQGCLHMVQCCIYFNYMYIITWAVFCKTDPRSVALADHDVLTVLCVRADNGNSTNNAVSSVKCLPMSTVVVITVGKVCVCWELTCEWNNLWLRCIIWHVNLTLSTTLSKVRVVGQMSRPREDKVAELVGRTSSEAF